jgi:predicted glycoside hydrolase/deacetylase ChbG (UPF0249 family)
MQAANLSSRLDLHPGSFWCITGQEEKGMAKRLIVNADDYGRTAGVSRGILKAHREGIVTSTTVMINQKGIESQVAQAIACSGLGIGLHLVFSSWRPVLPPEEVPGLVDEDGVFLDQHSLWARAEEIPIGQMAAEMRAQVQRFQALADRPPDHLDCHHFVHLYPPFFQVYADLAAELNLPLRVPFPSETEFHEAVRTLPFLEGFPRDLVRSIVVTNSALIRSRGLAHPDHFVATFFGSGALSLGFLLRILDELPDGISELMCHPGYDDPELSHSTYRAERAKELALLTHPAVREGIEARGIELVTFGALK